MSTVTNGYWREVDGTKGEYLVSSDGRVWSNRLGRELTLSTRQDGYSCVTLNLGGVQSQPRVHRLVAFAFLPKQDGKDFVNHKDECRSNNKVENLEWCHQAYNLSYSSAIKHGRPHEVVKSFVSPTGEVLQTEDISNFCKAHGLDQSALNKVALGKRNHHRGYSLYRQSGI